MSIRARILFSRGLSKRFSPGQLCYCSVIRIDIDLHISTLSSSIGSKLRCIKWVQESFPTGGECSGLVVMYEQCVRTFWHDERYREDLRYLKVWLEYVGVIIAFLIPLSFFPRLIG